MNAILKALFPKCIIESVDLYEQTVTIAATGSENFAKCPGCQEISRRVHSYYVRKPQDLPICGCFVRLRLRVRRFRYLNECCLKRTFAERWGDWLKPYAQKTARTVNALYHVSQVAGGEAGCRLLTHLKMKASGPILIRIIRRRPQVEMVNPQIIGVDDWSIRKGRTYGTIIVDLERGVPIDLLPDRTAETLASWLQARKALPTDGPRASLPPQSSPESPVSCR